MGALIKLNIGLGTVEEEDVGKESVQSITATSTQRRTAVAPSVQNHLSGKQPVEERNQLSSPVSQINVNTPSPLLRRKLLNYDREDQLMPLVATFAIQARWNMIITSDSSYIITAYL